MIWATQWYVKQFGDGLRYVKLFNKWFVWNGMWWEPEEEQVAKRLGQEAVLHVYADASKEQDDDKRGELRKLAVKLDNARTVEAMVAPASAQPPIAARADTFDQQDYQAVAANGVIDLRTGDLLAHQPLAYHTKHLGPTRAALVYDPAAQCPHFLAFLRMVLCEDEALMTFVQRASGYSLTGDISEQVWFLLPGEGNNGKTTLTRALRDVLGTYADTLPVTTLLASKYDQIPTDIAALVGLRGAFASENEEGRQLAESLLKSLTGGDEVRARFLRQDFFTFKPKLKLWLHTNHKPRIRDTSLGTWRRIRPIPFRYTIPETAVDPHFYERVLAPELPGILAWMVRGCLDWQREGLGEPEIVRSERACYQDESDVLNEFVDGYLWAAPGTTTKSTVIYELYLSWCRARGEQAVLQKALSQRVMQRYGIEPRNVGGRGMAFEGLGADSGHGFYGVGG